MSLQELPLELSEQIFSRLSVFELRVLSLVCKSLTHLVYGLYQTSGIELSPVFFNILLTEKEKEDYEDIITFHITKSSCKIVNYSRLFERNTRNRFYKLGYSKLGIIYQLGENLHFFRYPLNTPGRKQLPSLCKDNAKQNKYPGRSFSPIILCTYVV